MFNVLQSLILVCHFCIALKTVWAFCRRCWEFRIEWGWKNQFQIKFAPQFSSSLIIVATHKISTIRNFIDEFFQSRFVFSSAKHFKSSSRLDEHRRLCMNKKWVFHYHIFGNKIFTIQSNASSNGVFSVCQIVEKWANICELNLLKFHKKCVVKFKF